MRSGEGLAIVDTHHLERMRGPWSLRQRDLAEARCAQLNVDPMRPHAWVGSMADDVNVMLCALCYKHEAHAIHHEAEKKKNDA